MVEELLSRAASAGRNGWSDTLNSLVAARTVAATEYDLGRPEVAVQIYASVLLGLAAVDDVWVGSPGLETVAGTAFDTAKKAASPSAEPAGTLRDEVWTLRMAVDIVIDYLQAAALMEDFASSIHPSTWPGDRRNPYSYLFEPLRYAVERRRDKQIVLQEGTLESLCRAALDIAQSRLKALASEAADSQVDLHLAVLLRMTRWRLREDEAYGVESSRADVVRSAKEVVSDICYLDMMGFERMGYLQIGFSKNLVQFGDMGAAAVFDQYLSARGYARDEKYWDMAPARELPWRRAR